MCIDDSDQFTKSRFTLQKQETGDGQRSLHNLLQKAAGSKLVVSENFQLSRMISLFQHQGLLRLGSQRRFLQESRMVF